MQLRKPFSVGDKFFYFSGFMRKRNIWDMEMLAGLHSSTVISVQPLPHSPNHYKVITKYDASETSGRNFIVSPEENLDRKKMWNNHSIFPSLDHFLVTAVTRLNSDNANGKFKRFDETVKNLIIESQEKHPEIWI